MSINLNVHIHSWAFIYKTLSSIGILLATCLTVYKMDRLIKFKIVEWDWESNLKYNFLRYISKFLGVLRSTQDSDTPYVAVIAVLVVVIVVLVTALAVNVVILRYIPIIESLNPYFTCFYINYLLISSQWLYVFFKLYTSSV